MSKADPFGWIGHVLDEKYRIDAVVGEGGFGVVYHAHHLGFEQAVAVKCLKLNKNLEGGQHDAFLKKFLAEGRLLHRLSRATADVVQALDVGVATSPSGAETPYLVLEWLDGTTLDRDLRSRRGTTVPLRDAMALLEPAARGLACAHDQGISHRDVKPANLMLTEIGGRRTLKVVDFGIAKAPTDEPTEMSPHDGLGSGMQAFTPRYGAPEQFSRKFGPTGTFTDVYALALILVEVVIGRPALDGDDPVQLYVATSDPRHRPTIRTKGGETSDAVEAVLQKALEIEAAKRYATAGEFWDALSATLDPPLTARVRPPAISNGSTADVAAPPSVKTEPKRPHGRRLVWLGALALVALGGVVAFVAMHRADRAVVATPVDAASSSGGRPDNTPASTPVESPSAPHQEHGMALVPAGRFLMGADVGSRAERPQHPVRITRPFYIDTTEVTVDAYSACMNDHQCTAPKLRAPGPHGKGIVTSSTACNPTGDPSFARQPVNCVTYEQAATFCKHTNKRLPTEAEWELAARGTDGRTYPWGDAESSSCRFAITGGAQGPCGARKGTYEVGTTVDGKSPYGLFDMSGNVWEWVADDFDTYGKDEVVDPILPPRSGKGVIRGGSWDYNITAAKAYTRMSHERSLALNNVGFRCAKDPP